MSEAFDKVLSEKQELPACGWTQQDMQAGHEIFMRLMMDKPYDSHKYLVLYLRKYATRERQLSEAVTDLAAAHEEIKKLSTRIDSLLAPKPLAVEKESK